MKISLLHGRSPDIFHWSLYNKNRSPISVSYNFTLLNVEKCSEFTCNLSISSLSGPKVYSLKYSSKPDWLLKSTNWILAPLQIPIAIPMNYEQSLRQRNSIKNNQNWTLFGGDKKFESKRQLITLNWGEWGQVFNSYMI